MLGISYGSLRDCVYSTSAQREHADEFRLCACLDFTVEAKPRAERCMNSVKMGYVTPSLLHYSPQCWGFEAYFSFLILFYCLQIFSLVISTSTLPINQVLAHKITKPRFVLQSKATQRQTRPSEIDRRQNGARRLLNGGGL